MVQNSKRRRTNKKARLRSKTWYNQRNFYVSPRMDKVRRQLLDNLFSQSDPPKEEIRRAWIAGELTRFSQNARFLAASSHKGLRVWDPLFLQCFRSFLLDCYGGDEKKVTDTMEEIREIARSAFAGQINGCRSQLGQRLNLER